MATKVSPDSTASETSGASLLVPTDAELRAAAIKRLKAKREFRNHFFVYVLVNVALWVVWIINGAINEWVFPWPVFPTVFWGLVVAGQAYKLYWRAPLREEAVQREIESLRAASRAQPMDTYDMDDD